MCSILTSRRLRAAVTLGAILLTYTASQLRHPKIRAKLRDKWWLVECTITMMMFITLSFSGLGFFFCWCAARPGLHARTRRVSAWPALGEVAAPSSARPRAA